MILEVKNLSHGFGDRAIFENVSFRLLKGEHIGLIGANGEGKSTFMNIITGHLMPDEGTVEWAKNVRVGYLDQHAVLEKGMTIRDVLKSAFSYLFDMEADMNRMFEQMGEASPEEMEKLLEETGTIQELLEHHDFYMIECQSGRNRRALGLVDNQGLEPGCYGICPVAAYQSTDGKTASGKRISCFWTSQLTIWTNSILNG